MRVQLLSNSPIDSVLVLQEHHTLRHGTLVVRFCLSAGPSVSTTFRSRPLHPWHWACSTAVAPLKYLIATRNCASLPNPRSSLGQPTWRWIFYHWQRTSLSLKAALEITTWTWVGLFLVSVASRKSLKALVNTVFKSFTDHICEQINHS